MSNCSQFSAPNIRLAVEADQEKWDTYISSNPDGSPYHLFAWKKAVENGYGHKGYYLMAEGDSGECIGVFPLVCLKLPWGRKTLVSLPYCDYAGPLGESEIKRMLIDESRSLADSLQARTVELRLPETQSWRENDPARIVEDISHKVRMLLPLPNDSKVLWSGFKPKLRSQIKRPQKEGFGAQVGARELLDDFYRIFNINMHRLGSPVHHRRWFKALLDVYHDKIKIGIVYLRTGLPVAAGILLTSGRKVCVPWASSLREYNPVAPNMLLYYQFLTWATDNRCLEFDFGRSTPGEGTYRFKEQWGAEPQPLHWYRQTLNGAKTGEIVSDLNRRDKIANLWSRLPLWTVTLIGPKIRKYISL